MIPARYAEEIAAAVFDELRAGHTIEKLTPGVSPLSVVYVKTTAVLARLHGLNSSQAWKIIYAIEGRLIEERKRTANAGS